MLMNTDNQADASSGEPGWVRLGRGVLRGQGTSQGPGGLLRRRAQTRSDQISGPGLLR
jgi:hypothetical protein